MGIASRLTLGVLSLGWLVLFPGCGSSKNEIIRLSRQNNSGTYVYFREVVLGERRDFKLGSIDLNGSKDVVEMTAATPSAIGYSGMGYATDGVKMLKISRTGAPPVAPTLESARNGSYPLARPLFVYTVGPPRGAVKHYIDWILSREGQAIVAEIGYVPAPDAGGESPQEPPSTASIKIAGSDTMVNLAQAWAETYSREFPQVRPEVAGGGSGVGIAKLIDGTVQIANASREMKDEERLQIEARHGQPVSEFLVAIDALAVFVHRENPLMEIPLEELAEIYGDGGSITTWSQVKDWPSHVWQ